MSANHLSKCFFLLFFFLGLSLSLFFKQVFLIDLLEDTSFCNIIKDAVGQTVSSGSQATRSICPAQLKMPAVRVSYFRTASLSGVCTYSC